MTDFKPQSPIAVANFIIDRSKKAGTPVSNLQLQKILYFLQAAFIIKNNGTPLFNGKFSRWGYGPVQNPNLPAKVIVKNATPNEVFRDNKDEFTLKLPIHVDDVAFKNSIWQFINRDLAGLSQAPTDQDWKDNGIPLAIVDRSDGGDNNNVGSGATVKMQDHYSYGVINKYNDVDPNYCSVLMGSYGEVWFNSDALLNRF